VTIDIDCGSLESLRSLNDATALLFLVLSRNLTRPPILAEFIFTAEKDPAAVVAVEMLKPALCSGFQAPGVSSQATVWDSQRIPQRVISTAKLRILPISQGRLLYSIFA